MNFHQIKKHYGTVAKAAIEIGVTRQTVYEWRKIGVPDDAQLEIQRDTKGALKADPRIVTKYRELLQAA